MRGGRYPTLRRQRGGKVHGAVFLAPAAVLARLAAYEGAAYRLVRVVVDTPTARLRPRLDRTGRHPPFRGKE